METNVIRNFETWYGGFHASLEAVLASTFGDDDLARDVAAEALVRAYERWDRVGSMRSPEGWTYRVAFNLARRRLRRRALELRLLRRSVTDQGRPVGGFAGSGDHGASVAGPGGELWHLVAALPERQRQAVALRHVAGLTESAIGEVMGVARGTVSATLHAAYRRLRTELDHDPPASAHPEPGSAEQQAPSGDRLAGGELAINGGERW